MSFKRILILAPHPPSVSASQRFRFEHYLTYLAENEFSYDYEPFIDLKTWKILLLPGHFSQKVFGILMGFFNRFLLLGSLGKYDYVFIHREAAPVGPPFFEWWISKIAGKKIIYDFDDAIWFKVASKSNPYAGWIKWPGKVKHICSYSWKVTTGNSWLASYAKNYSSNVVVVPTVVETDKVHSRIKEYNGSLVTIGWTGTFTNFPYLKMVTSTIHQLAEKFAFQFVIIADKDPLFDNCKYVYKRWNKISEIDDLLEFDIGLMPLPDTDLAKGKCAFKAIQYMALGVPAVVSNVGANNEVVDNGINGFVCNNEQDWLEVLSLLLNDADLRKNMGKLARKKIVESYSVTATRTLFASLFEG
ncbi:MAG: glycosyltransferase family 4 protein [Bacteroidota bacterium]